MAFIKIKNLVINTNYIAAVRLENQDFPQENSVSILLATPAFPLPELSPPAIPNSYHYEWLDFLDREADVLRDFFSNFNNGVTDLMLKH